jgi:hypothetical protein
MPTIKGKSTPETRRRATGFPLVYTDAEQARLLAPISIRSFGGKSWGGAVPNSQHIPTRNHRHTGESFDRYAQSSDWADVDHL